MRILMLEPNLIPTSPAGGQMLLLAERLCDRHEVTVVATRVDPRLAAKVEWIRIRQTGRVSFLGDLFFQQRAYSRALRQLASRGGRFDVVHSSDPKLRPPLALAYGKYVATWHFCASQAWHVWLTGGMRYPGRDPRLKLWYNCLGWVRWGIPALIERLRVQAQFHEGVTWVAVSEGVASAIRRYWGLEVPVEVVPNAIELGRFNNLGILRQRTRTQLRISEETVLLLTVAHGQWGRKGVFEVLLALTKVEGEVTLVVVGGSHLGHLRTEVDRLNLSDRVILVGFTDDPRPYYAAADIFVFSSHYESFGLAPMEAAASGLPILATRVHGVSEWMEDGRTGFFIEHDPSDIARKIELLAGDKDLRRQLGEAARQAVAKYTPERMCRAYERIYETGMERRSN